MTTLLTTQMQLPVRLIICCSPSLTLQKVEQYSSFRHTCLCCSYILLRHIDSQRIYWRCSHCYQEMLASEDNRKILFFPTFTDYSRIK